MGSDTSQLGFHFGQEWYLEMVPGDGSSWSPPPAIPSPLQPPLANEMEQVKEIFADMQLLRFL